MLTAAAAFAVPLSCAVRAEPPNAGKQLDDGAISTAVESEFFEDPSIPHHAIDITARNGIVTLTGTLATCSHVTTRRSSRKRFAASGRW